MATVEGRPWRPPTRTSSSSSSRSKWRSWRRRRRRQPSRGRRQRIPRRRRPPPPSPWPHASPPTSTSPTTARRWPSSRLPRPAVGFGWPCWTRRSPSLVLNRHRSRRLTCQEYDHCYIFLYIYIRMYVYMMVWTVEDWSELGLLRRWCSGEVKVIGRRRREEVAGIICSTEVSGTWKIGRYKNVNDFWFFISKKKIKNIFLISIIIGKINNSFMLINQDSTDNRDILLVQ